MKKATFAGGCFWCLEPPFEMLKGVTSVTSGYIGGTEENAHYNAVSTGETAHFEAVEILFDPKKISYKELLDIFWQQIDPTDEGGQFADRGPQYQTAIFVHDDTQLKLAHQSRDSLAKSNKFDKPIVTPIIPADTFYKAEDYHQDYYKKNAAHYQRYKEGSGRSSFLAMVWPSKQKQNLKEKLSKIQYHVTQENGTEPPFENEYWDNKDAGIYVDIISGKPLFSSLDKFDSGTGWPCFTRTIDEAEIVKKADCSHFMNRTEVRSKTSDSHLGHVFDDGPKDKGGARYCINSAALRFIPVKELEKEGYGQYLNLFK